MKKSILFFVLFITYNLSFAQTPIGVKFDINGMSLNGYYDPLIYSPEKKISKIHFSDSYEKGYYYDSLGTKIDGLIKFEDDKIFYKKKDEDSRTKIKSDVIKRFVIGVDSFFVVDKFYYKDKLKEKPEFVQYIAEFNGYTFVKHYHFTSGLALQFGPDSPIVETFLVKHKDSIIWDNFPDNKHFKEKALKYFSYIPYLKEKIITEKYKSKDMLSVIKMAEYLEKYNNSKSIYYDKYWQEIRDKRKAAYEVKIVNKKDSIWTLDYYKDNEKIYQGNYSSFYPNIKNGDFTAFNPDGSTRLISSFIKNKSIKLKTYSKVEKLEKEYKIIEFKKEYDSNTSFDLQYVTVNDDSGSNIIKSNGISFLSKKDELNGQIYNYKFNDYKLESVYRVSQNDTIFKISDPNYNFKISSLQSKFDSFMEERKYEDALNENAQGIILASFLIDPKGYVVESTILNKIHPDLDNLVTIFINTKILEGAEFRYSFKSYKVNKKKYYYEIVVPFEFSISRYYRRPVNYNHFYNDFFHRQMMNNHFERMNNFKPSIPTRMPGF